MTTATHPVEDVTHELVLHDGAPGLVDVAVPFLRDGTAAGDEVFVMGDAAFVSALLADVPDLPPGHVMTAADGERVPARDLHRFERTLAPLGRSARVRVVNQMPVMTPARWPEWRRYEAAVNVVLTPYRVWGKCGYDTEGLDAGMVADLRANHPFVHTPDGCRPSPPFDELDTRVGGYLDVPRHPVEDTEPALVLPGATPARARRAVRGLAVRAGLPPIVQEALVLAANEAVTNARLHGRPPVRLRAWLTGPHTGTPTGTLTDTLTGTLTDTGGRTGVTVAVDDTGPGPHPLVGMVPEDRDGARGGGLWVVHQLLPDVHHRTGPGGYTVTFAADDATVLPGSGGGPGHG